MACPICHNDITDINKVVTECNHVFHFTCIYKNLKTNISTGEQCPLCRKSFNTPTKSFSLCPPGATIGEQQIRIIQNLFRTPQIPRPQNTLIRMMTERRRNRLVSTHTEPYRVRIEFADER